jgi:hypothetical protein
MSTRPLDIDAVSPVDRTEATPVDGAAASIHSSSSMPEGWAPGVPESPRPLVRTKRSKRSSTFTSQPDTAPPELVCPSCDRPLTYQQTVISGVKPIERWDYLDCRTCGNFVYRHRTRKLRKST